MAAPLMTIGTVARRSGVPMWRLRAWDASGVLRAQRSQAGYRLYTAEQITQAEALGREVESGGRLGVALPVGMEIGYDGRHAATAERRASQVDRRLHLVRQLQFVSDHTGQLEVLAAAAVRHALELTGATAGSICLADLTRQEYSLLAGEGIDQSFLADGPAWRLHDGLAGQVFGLREPVNVDDLFERATFRRESLVRHGLRAYVCVPLIRDNRRFGIFEIFSHQPGVFGSEDIATLELIAGVITPSIEIAELKRGSRLLEQERTKYFRAVTKQLAESTRLLRADVVARLRETVASHTDDAGPDQPTGLAGAIAAIANDLERHARGGIDLAALLRQGVIDQVSRAGGLTASLDAAGWPEALDAEFGSSLYVVVLALAEEFARRARRSLSMRLRLSEDSDYIVEIDGDCADEDGDPRHWSVEANNQLHRLGGVMDHARRGDRTRLTLRIPRSEREELLGLLTGRERATLDVLGNGMPNRDLAALLGITPKTLQNHLTSIYRKLRVSSRGEAVALLHSGNQAEIQ
ncbi:GAF domain-containing protein [Nocardia sp. SYP-A9097]|uniref:GAF domain-containing protein n=1 Tax=Nocardia sp. SYP-A9097 TaxID=2663237 RepID=UPI00129AA6B5|nr:GAF domain-containing protein [Nocardia sp. SYP-A9097]MRH90091.1 GAF domain-containing protein [Nocardia sp. SYP-A9097]